MKLKTYLKSLKTHKEKESFAKKADTSLAYLQQLGSGFRNAGLKTILNIEAASDNQVTRYDLRPDLFKRGRAA